MSPMFSLEQFLAGRDIASLTFILFITFTSFTALVVVLNVLQQKVCRNRHEPPVVFHWLPIIGSSISYGIDPFRFFAESREKYGDVFTFILLGKKTTVCLGAGGNSLVLNGKQKDVNAEDVYGPITTPIFGKDVIYDCPNAKLMEQKKFVKSGLTTAALRSYVLLIASETLSFTQHSSHFQLSRNTLDVGSSMAELTLFTASRSLQGREVRERFDTTFATLYHDLDMGLKPINLIMPRAPLWSNWKRDRAHQRMAETYISIVKERRRRESEGETGGRQEEEEDDMIATLMKARYKDGRAVPDHEIANMMIALLMAGQHSSSSTISWTLLRLASRPEITEELLQEQKDILGVDLPPLQYEHLARLTLHENVIKETLRLHAPIHSIMRKVTTALPVEGSSYVIPVGHVVLAAPGVSARQAEFFPNPMHWDPHRWSDAYTNGFNAPDDTLTVRGGSISKGTHSPYLPFGAGRHRCKGEQFAYVQLQTILALLVREFKFTNVDGRAEVAAETDFSSMFTKPVDPALVEYQRRHIE